MYHIEVDKDRTLTVSNRGNILVTDDTCGIGLNDKTLLYKHRQSCHAFACGAQSLKTVKKGCSVDLLIDRRCLASYTKSLLRRS